MSARGITVPWNASWSAEDDYEVRNCRWAGGKPAIWSPHRPGEGKPIFAKPHTVRQRRSIAEYRCTVCGERTLPWDRWWFGLGNRIDGWAFATVEAPVHAECAAKALRLCPHLQTLGVMPERFPPPDDVVSAIVGGLATEHDFGIDLCGRKVVGHLKFAWRRLPLLPEARERRDQIEAAQKGGA